MFESLSMKWNRRFCGLTMFVFNFGVGSFKQSVKLGFDNKVFDFQQFFSQFFRFLSCFSAAVAKENLRKTPAVVSLANVQIFKFCCDIQGSHMIGYL